MSIIDVKNSLTVVLCCVERSSTVSELSVGAGAAKAAIEKNVWESQHVVSSLDVYAERVYSSDRKDRAYARIR